MGENSRLWSWFEVDTGGQTFREVCEYGILKIEIYAFRHVSYLPAVEHKLGSTDGCNWCATMTFQILSFGCLKQLPLYAG